MLKSFIHFLMKEMVRIAEKIIYHNLKKVLRKGLMQRKVDKLKRILMGGTKEKQENKENKENQDGNLISKWKVRIVKSVSNDSNPT
jgi:radical SAM superfamily enzyme with C-terminal helix-hairpin-helix motif